MAPKRNSQKTVPTIGPLLNTLHNLALDEFSDVTIKCRDHAWKAHRVILASKCDFFRVCCSEGFQESSSRVIDLSDDDPAALDVILRYLYTGEVYHLRDGFEHQKLPPNFLVTLLEVYTLADKYGLSDLAPEIKALLSNTDHMCQSCYFNSERNVGCTDIANHLDQVMEVLCWLWKHHNNSFDSRSREALLQMYTRTLSQRMPLYTDGMNKQGAEPSGQIDTEEASTRHSSTKNRGEDDAKSLEQFVAVRDLLRQDPDFAMVAIALTSEQWSQALSREDQLIEKLHNEKDNSRKLKKQLNQQKRELKRATEAHAKTEADLLDGLDELQVIESAIDTVARRAWVDEENETTQADVGGGW